MSLKIKIRGFQSVKNPVEIIVDGYCTIEGESNLGKSAVIRAIHAALCNRAGTEFITEDELDCEVIIESLGHTIKWAKSRKATVYEIDGNKINKPGKGTIPDEVRIAGLYAIRTLDKELHWPQFHFQWDQPFIVGSYTDILAAELLGASKETVTIGKAIKLVNQDVTKCKTRTDFLERQHLELVANVRIMEEIATRLNATQQEVDQVEAVRNAALKQESTYQELIGRYRSSWSGWKVSSVAAKVTIPSVLDVSSHARLTDIYRRYTRALSLVDLSSKNQGIVPEAPDNRQHITDIIRLYKESNRVSQQIQIMASVVSISQPKRPDGQGIASRIQSLKSLQTQFLKAQKELDSSIRVKGEIDTELREIDEERKKINYFVGSIERCPLCLAPMKDGVYCPEEAHNGRQENIQAGVTGESDPSVSCNS